MLESTDAHGPQAPAKPKEDVLNRVPGGKKTWILFGILVLVVVWIASGVLLREDDPADPTAEPDERRTTVAVRESQARPVERVLILHGDLQPEQLVIVRAETGG